MREDYTGSLDISESLEEDRDKPEVGSCKARACPVVQGKRADSSKKKASPEKASKEEKESDLKVSGPDKNEQKKAGRDRHHHHGSEGHNSKIIDDLRPVFLQVKRFQAPIFIIIAIILSIIVRAHFAGIPLTDDWAMQSARSGLEAKLSPEIDRMYSSLPDSSREAILQEQIEDMLSEQRYKKAIAEKSELLKESFKAADGTTYLFGIDGYSYYKAMNEKDFSTFMGFFGYYWHKAYSFLSPDASMMKSAFLIPYIFVSLSVIIVFLLARRIGNDISAFLAAAMFAIHPEFLKYSLAGIVDTNTANIFFLLLTLWLFAEAFDYKSIFRTALFSVGAISSLLLFWYTWPGYYIVIMIILVSAAAYYAIMLANFLMKKLSTGQKVLVFGAAFALLLISVSFFDAFASLLPYRVQLYLNLVDVKGIWPSGYEMIIEQRNLSLGEIVYKGGGRFVIAFSAFAYLYLAYMATVRRYPKAKDAIMLLISVSVFVFAATKLVRFMPFAIPFICILFASGLGLFLNYAAGTVIKSLDSKNKMITAVSYAVVLVLISVPVGMSFADNYGSVKTIRPVMDDSVYDSAMNIKLDSAEDAVISAWWDKGHFFDAIAERKVNAKASPQMPVTYWLSRAWSTGNEDYSVNVLRMLNCGSPNRALSAIEEKHSPYDSINILHDVLAMNRSSAEAYLFQKGIEPSAVMKPVFCGPKENYVVIVDDQMASYSNVLYYANWDVRFGSIKGMGKQDAVSYLEDNYGMGTDDAKSLYNDYLSYSREDFKSLAQYGCGKSGSRFTCTVPVNGKNTVIIFDTETLETNFRPQRLYVVDGDVLEYGFNESTGTVAPYVMIIYNRAGNYHATIADPVTAKSMFVRLLLLEGKGLDNFKQISDISKPETKRVVVYKASWT